MKILLACSVGMSTSLLEKSIKDYMEANAIDGSVMVMSAEAAKNEVNNFDVVLLGPQIKFMLPEFMELSEQTPVEVIPSHDYALANGEAAYEFAKSLMK